ncbi:hypothetical protein HYDPIDRAFT_26886 [Hydnomerulius pinastri MD-312]|nr:hypothetical protein HYDPIDRAFT_26886 [Hydnomerulius pinastri MD-312]
MATYYYDYALTDQWLVQEAKRRGIPSDGKPIDKWSLIVSVVYVLTAEAGIFGLNVSQLKRVWATKTGSDVEGKYWCIALASSCGDDPLPQYIGRGKPPVSPERYAALKNLLGKTDEPAWYHYVG